MNRATVGGTYAGAVLLKTDADGFGALRLNILAE